MVWVKPLDYCNNCGTTLTLEAFETENQKTKTDTNGILCFYNHYYKGYYDQNPPKIIRNKDEVMGQDYICYCSQVCNKNYRILRNHYGPDLNFIFKNFVFPISIEETYKKIQWELEAKRKNALVLLILARNNGVGLLGCLPMEVLSILARVSCLLESVILENRRDSINLGAYKSVLRRKKMEIRKKIKLESV
jgi:hypothetical protein